MEHENSSIKAILYALAANFGIAIAKGIAAFITGSGSMLAETIHSIADCMNQLLLLIGLKRSKRLPTDEHPLGYGKVTYFWSFIVAMLLFSIGGLFSIYEGLHKLQSTEQINSVWIALVVLGVSIILESLSLTGAIKEINKLRKDESFSRWLKETRNSELIVVLGEDIAAVMGLCLAFIFVSLSVVLHNPVYDAIGSIIIGVILIIISIFLIIRMKTLLIGKSADPDIVLSINDIIKKNSNINEVYNLITMQFGPYIMLSGKIRLKSNLTIEEACLVINAIEQAVKMGHPEIKWTFIEPDVKD